MSLIQTVYHSSARRHSRIDWLKVNLQNDPQHPCCKVDTDLNSQEIPGVSTGEKQEVTPARMMEQKGERVVNRGVLGYDL